MKRVAVLFLFPALMQGWQGPAFEVADIKPSDPSVQKPGKGRILPGGRIQVPGQSVRDLISFAYAVQDDMIVGAPKWAGEERFDIVAKAPASAPATPDALRGMMRALLAERFQLTTHNQDKLMPAYVLTLAKDSPAIRATSGGQTSCHWTSNSDSLRRRECHNMTMEEFARELPNTGGIGITFPVKDQTGLTGGYDFEFEVGTITRRAPEAGAGGELPAVEESGPTIFAALLRMGLRLQEKKIMLPALVIDRVERPVKN